MGRRGALARYDLPVITDDRPRTGAGRLAFALACLAALTAPWNAVGFHGLNVSDYLVIAAALLGLGTIARRPAITWWMLAGAVLLTVSAFITQLFPPGADYMASRYFEIDPHVLYAHETVLSGNLSQWGKFIFAWLIFPAILASLATGRDRIRRLGDWWGLGVLVNAVVALASSAGLTTITAQLNGFIDTTGRQSGLTTQPNHLAVSAVLAVPVFCMWIRRPARWKIAGVVALVVDGLALNSSGSRGPVAVLVPVLLLLLMFAGPRTKRAFVVAAPFLLAMLIVAFPLIRDTLAHGTLGDRIASGVTTASSDSTRLLLLGQGWHDFATHFLSGIGFGWITAAHNLYVQLLAATGIIGFLGAMIYLIGMLRAAWRVRRLSDSAAAACASVIAWLLDGFLENQINDRYLFVPVAMIIAADVIRRRSEVSAVGVDATAAQNVKELALRP